MITHQMEQGSPEWYAVKLGKFSASLISKLLMGKSTAGYNEAIDRIVYERVTGKRIETYVNGDMKYGTDTEPLARNWYSHNFFRKVHEVGFIEASEWYGASPDGLVGSDGMVEIKCPKWNTQLARLREFSANGSMSISKDYMMQMQLQMYVADRKWCDFVSYRDDLKPVVQRVERNEAIITQLKGELNIAIGEVKTRVKLYNNAA